MVPHLADGVLDKVAAVQTNKLGVRPIEHFQQCWDSVGVVAVRFFTLFVVELAQWAASAQAVSLYLDPHRLHALTSCLGIGEHALQAQDLCRLLAVGDYVWVAVEDVREPAGADRPGLHQNKVRDVRQFPLLLHLELVGLVAQKGSERAATACVLTQGKRSQGREKQQAGGNGHPWATAAFVTTSGLR